MIESLRAKKVNSFTAKLKEIQKGAMTSSIEHRMSRHNPMLNRTFQSPEVTGELIKMYEK